jgi:hypothetical protein
MDNVQNCDSYSNIMLPRHILELTVREPGWLSRYSDGHAFPAVERYFSLLRSVRTGCGAHPRSHPMCDGGRGIFLKGIKLQGREDNLSLYPTSKFRMMALYLQYLSIFMA